MQLSYDEPTPLTSKAHATLPFGHVLMKRACDVAAMIPEAWPMQIAPWQFVSTVAPSVCSDDALPHALRCTYQLGDVTRETHIGAISADIASFLKHELALPALPAVWLLRSTVSRRVERGEPFCAASGLHPISPEATAGPEPKTVGDGRTGCDLFNLAANNMSKDATAQLLVLFDPRPQTALPLVAPNGPPAPIAPPEIPPLMQIIRLARDGAGNTRPLAPDHNPMLNELCAAPLEHAPSTGLPQTRAEYRRLGKHLLAIEQQPIRCCFNCGMVNYPTNGDVIQVRASQLSDLRAWRVYGDCIKQFTEDNGLAEPSLTVGDDPRSEVFLCEQVGDGVHCSVYSCSSCKREVRQDPTKYDLFDGHTAIPPTAFGDVTTWRYDGNGVGEPFPEPLAALTSDERLMLGVVKMADAAFEPAYSSAGYTHFANGGLLCPGDFHGLSTLLVRNEITAPTLEDALISPWRLRAALAYLTGPTGNPLVHHTLTCFQREVRKRAACVPPLIRLGSRSPERPHQSGTAS